MPKKIQLKKSGSDSDHNRQSEAEPRKAVKESTDQDERGQGGDDGRGGKLWIGYNGWLRMWDGGRTL